VLHRGECSATFIVNLLRVLFGKKDSTSPVVRE
jgi:hypothetical protein